MPVFLVAASVAAAAIHVALGPGHVAELGWLGSGFYLAGALQLGWAALAVAGTRSLATGSRFAGLVFPVAVAINLAILGAWVASRTVGLPAGDVPWTPEAIGISDSITALMEAGIVLGAINRLRRPAGHALEPASPAGRGFPSLLAAAPVLAVLLVATVTALGASHAHAATGGHDAATETVVGAPHGH